MTSSLITKLEEAREGSRAFEVLRELQGCANTGLEWARPLDVGGTNGSDHSYVLSKLVKVGFAESRPRNSWAVSRGSKEYRITDAGRKVMDILTAKHKETTT